MRFYDPDQLVNEVQELLASRGLAAGTTDALTARTGACQLLRGLGITPAIDAVEAYTRSYAAGPWPDADDRRAS